ncbi:hypothetical protein AVEN_69038-1 [Araneus ventricosus]|uniref:Uncharacterized protein n=1 Tax=Araneus ventricosus TaxID=182803 RepID=A0A4Y2VGV2_ARAVE|nr:hypothetical protein AVEN_271372-1 [Araneus ventricosus]GBO23534.1 hypothetical protein AVEN_69038-1 [Araneus ventricosus]
MQRRGNKKDKSETEETVQRNEGNSLDMSQSHATESSQQHEARNEASRYNSKIEYSLQPVEVVESMNKLCTNCKALKFTNEAHGMCCLNGKVKLPPLKAPLEPSFSLVAGTTT